MPIENSDTANKNTANTGKVSLGSTKLDLIEQQLGRQPRGLRAIAHSTPTGVPVVLKMAPVVNKQPFPTLYWLSAKDLHKAISQIEAQGIIKQWEQKLHNEPSWQAIYNQQHLNYIKERWESCTPEDHNFLRQHDFQTMLNHKGIGGLGNWQQIRCLHMHYAHHLCGTNIIGQWMDEAYPHLKELAITI